MPALEISGPMALKVREAAMIHRIVAVGAGQMGSGIAHVAALAGLDVGLIDVSVEISERAVQAIRRNIDRQVARGGVAAGAVEGDLGADPAWNRPSRGRRCRPRHQQISRIPPRRRALRALTRTGGLVASRGWGFERTTSTTSCGSGKIVSLGSIRLRAKLANSCA